MAGAQDAHDPKCSLFSTGTCDCFPVGGLAVALISDLRKRVVDLQDALSEAIEGWEEGASYKGEYLAQKHRDAEGIAKARAALQQK